MFARGSSNEHYNFDCKIYAGYHVPSKWGLNSSAQQAKGLPFAWHKQMVLARESQRGHVHFGSDTRLSWQPPALQLFPTLLFSYTKAATQS